MFLLIVIIILITATSILGNIYLGIFSFQKNYNSLDQYQNSYYAAISSIERGMLATKYKEAGFEGSGGFIGDQNWGPISDLLTGELGKLSEDDNGFYWHITSKTNNLTGVLNYDDLLEILLFVDPDNQAYTGTNLDGITYDIFNGNDTITINLSKNNQVGNIDPVDDIPIRRKLNISNDNNETYIIANSGSYDGNNIFNNNLNNNNTFIFGRNIDNIHLSSTSTGDGFCTNRFCYSPETDIAFILSGGYTTGLVLNITGNYLKHNDYNIIPNVLYNIISTKEISDTHYTIIGEAIIGNYKKTITIKKPISNYKNPNRKNFIFPYYK